MANRGIEYRIYYDEDKYIDPKIFLHTDITDERLLVSNMYKNNETDWFNYNVPFVREIPEKYECEFKLTTSEKYRLTQYLKNTKLNVVKHGFFEVGYVYNYWGETEVQELK